eukprot:12152673-Alexandrium_andersonii.AAC.1
MCIRDRIGRSPPWALLASTGGRRTRARPVTGSRGRRTLRRTGRARSTSARPSPLSLMARW